MTLTRRSFTRNTLGAMLIGAVGKSLTHSADSHGQTSGTATRATPFTIDIPEAVLTDLRNRLANTRWPDQIGGSGWDYGADTVYLRELLAYWQHDFDWRKQEARLNSFANFKAQVDGVDLHFVHARSSQPGAMPLLLLHGWPSSFVQMLDIIPLLTAPPAGEQAFDVVVASLPGFGFSAIPTERGVGFARIADLLSMLMTDVLGYPRYGLRGSDLGGPICVQMALAHPERIIGVHFTGIIGAAGAQPPPEFTAAEQAFVAASQAMNQTEVSYARLHMSKPQTLAHALNDSPAGLAAWIIEKFRSWADTGGNIESRFSKDELLTNLTIYWVTATINPSMRVYYEFVRERARTGRVAAPVGMLMSHKDLFPAAPREYGERLYNIARWTDTDVGGHFLEWEEPDLVARELRAFFSAI